MSQDDMHVRPSNRLTALGHLSTSVTSAERQGYPTVSGVDEVEGQTRLTWVTVSKEFISSKNGWISFFILREVE